MGPIRLFYIMAATAALFFASLSIGSADDMENVPIIEVKITAHEQQRLDDLIDAAQHGDWQQFTRLSDEPFGNVESMKEQFFGTSEILRKGTLTKNETKAFVSQGQRSVAAYLKFDENGKTYDTSIMLFTASQDGNGEISVILFNTMSDDAFAQ